MAKHADIDMTVMKEVYTHRSLETQGMAHQVELQEKGQGTVRSQKGKREKGT